MLASLHLLRHGEVLNPAGVVYADLPGFGLSPTGAAQAAAAAEHLCEAGIDVILSSPLERARQTAGLVARAAGLDVAIDDRLTEWHVASRWAGTPWAALPRRFPGELEAYMETPDRLPFAPEQIGEVADRMEAVVADLEERHPAARAVLVSHQDPLQSLRLRLLRRDLATLNSDKQGHAAVVTLARSAHEWHETARWDPAATSAPFPPVDEQHSP